MIYVARQRTRGHGNKEIHFQQATLTSVQDRVERRYHHLKNDGIEKRKDKIERIEN